MAIIQITIDTNILAAKMKECGYDPEVNEEEGWSYALIDALEDYTEIETIMHKHFQK